MSHAQVREVNLFSLSVFRIMYWTNWKKITILVKLFKYSVNLVVYKTCVRLYNVFT